MPQLSDQLRDRVRLPQPIYLLRIDGGRLSPAAWDAIGLVIELSEATVYLSVRNGYIFGYPAVVDEESLCQAVALRRTFDKAMGKHREVSLSASRWGHRNSADVLVEPWKHLGSARLEEALRRHVGFERIDPDGTRPLPDKRIERLTRALEQGRRAPARRH